MVSIDGTDINGATIDAADVTEITIDGVVAWKAGLSTIANYLEDDFGDNSLTGRSNTEDGVYASPQANEAGDVLIGRYRPEWSTESGSASASNGVLDLSDGGTTDNRVATPSKFNTGEWTFDLASSGRTDFVFLASSPGAQTSSSQYGYFFNISAPTDGHVQLLKSDGGSLTDIFENASSNRADGTQRTYTITRDTYGNFEVTENGSSVGTGTDTTFTSGSYTVAAHRESGTGTFDNLIVK